MDKNTDKFFREEFEIDEVSEKITVPDFSGGRRSRFIHDFKTVSFLFLYLGIFFCYEQSLVRGRPVELRVGVRSFFNGVFSVRVSYPTLKRLEMDA